MPELKRVLWIVDSLNRDAGTERQLLELARRLDRQLLKLEIAVLETFTGSVEPGSHARVLNFPVERCWSPRGLFQILKLARRIRKERIDVVHGFMFKSSLVAVLAGVFARTKVILTSRRNLGYFHTRSTRFLMRFLDRFVTRVVANSEACRRAAMDQEKIPGDKIDVLYNGVDCSRFSHSSEDEDAVPLPKDMRVVGMVANYRQVKNIPLFLRAAALVAREVPDCVFLLVGAGEEQSALQRLGVELGIGDRVFFTAGRGSVPFYLQRMHVGCLSSFSEGFSNSILEYMAAGLPVVATDVGGNSEAVLEGKSGFLVPPSSPDLFASRIITLLQNENLRLELGRNGQEFCFSRFDIDSAVRQLEQYYLTLHSPLHVKTSKVTRKSSVDESYEGSHAFSAAERLCRMQRTVDR